MIPTLPLRSRNRLAHLILTALRDAGARAELSALAREGTAHDAWLDAGEASLAPRLIARARAADAALADLPVLDPERRFDDALVAARCLFDAGVLFEVHEVLEPHWRDATGPVREALQGLIQIAVGYQHLANDNLDGARALLDEGVERLRNCRLDRRLDGRLDGRIDGLDVDAFVEAVRASTRRLTDLDARSLPRFPRLERPTIRSDTHTGGTT